MRGAADGMRTTIVGFELLVVKESAVKFRRVPLTKWANTCVVILCH